MIEVKPSTIRDLTYILSHLRDGDRDELFCQVPETNDPVMALAWASYQSTFSWCCHWQLIPVSAFGYMPVSMCGSVWSVWAYGTEKMIRTIPTIQKWCLEHGPVDLERARRLEARSLSTHVHAHTWLQSLGFECDAVLKDFGRNGESFLLWSITRENYEAGNVLLPKGARSAPETENPNQGGRADAGAGRDPAPVGRSAWATGNGHFLTDR